MARERTIWIVAAIWDSFRILIVFVLLSLFQEILFAIPDALYAALLGPALVFPATAMVLARREPSKSGLTFIWFLSKLFSLCSLLYLGIRALLASFPGTADGAAIVVSIPQAASFMLVLIFIGIVDLVLGIYGLSQLRKAASTGQDVGGEA